MIELTLAAGVDRLERQNRLMRRALTALALAAGAAVWMAQAPLVPPEVRARRIAIVNGDGETVIELHADRGVPAVALRAGDEVLVELAGSHGGSGSIRYRDVDGTMHDLTAPMGPRPATRR